jgi:hypothetical protein
VGLFANDECVHSFALGGGSTAHSVLTSHNKPVAHHPISSRRRYYSTQCTDTPQHTQVGVDLNDPKWRETLLAAGFDATVPTVWLAEGLSMYLEPHAMDALTTTLFELSAPHSVLLVSMVNAAAVVKAQVRCPWRLRLRASGGRVAPPPASRARGWVMRSAGHAPVKKCRV